MSASANDLSPGFIVIHGNQSETLRDLLRDWIRAHPLAPLENEIILVQSNGIAQWLTLSLAADAGPDGEGGLGIAAALDLQLPSRFIWQVYRHVLGGQDVPEQAPFGRELLLWRLMRLLPACLDQPVFAPLGRFLQDDPQLQRRHQLADRLAGLYDQYQVYRADWLADWAAGRDVLRTQRRGVIAMPDDARWQPQLWRELLADAGPDAALGNRAAIHQRFIAACAQAGGQRPAGLPRRVLVFGISALPRQALDVLALLGRWCQVLMCVQNPCRHFWADIVPERELLAARRFRHAPRRNQAAVLPRLSGIDHGHALLASWGRQGRDLIGLLAEHDEHELADSRLQQISRRADLFVDLAADTLLRQLQQDILDLEPLSGTRARWPLVDADRDISVRFHICHSPQREVEVLHDQLLAAFAADPTLRPRDVIVMVPDIQVFAPHVEAVFGLYSPEDPRFIPFSMADQPQRGHEPLLLAIEFLLSLPQARMTASDVLSLLDVSALRQRFGLADADLPLLRRWIDQSGIRWGLDRQQRASLDAGDPVEYNSWHFGLQRMLLGYAVGDGGSWGGIEPLDEISGLDAALLGNLLALIDALAETWRDFSRPATPQVWITRLRAMLARFFEASTEREAQILWRLEEGLQQWLDDCEATAMALPLPLTVVRDHWLASAEPDGLGQRFFAGAVTFATLMPMRAVPFRQVCLLGMNDRAFPREQQPADFDLMATDYRPGDRSRREDDRYLFLEALLSARERLYISWEGRSAHDDSVQPPSVLVAQLRDHLEAGWQLAGASDREQEALLARLTTSHRLQPFAMAYFAEAEPGPDTGSGTGTGSGQKLPAGDGLFSHAREWAQALQGAAGGQSGPGGEQAAAGRPAATLAAAARLDPAGLPARISLDELAAFAAHPVRHFFGKRLDIHLRQLEEEDVDTEPFRVDGLKRWQISEELIGALQHALWQGQPVGPVLDAGLARVQRRGELPVGGFGVLAQEALHATLAELFDDYVQRLDIVPERLPDQLIDWPAVIDEAGRRLPAVSGRIEQLRADARGSRYRILLSTSALLTGSGRNASYRYAQLLRYWASHLAAHLDGQSLTTVICSSKGQLELAPLPHDEALFAWQALLQSWHEGMCRPLPFAARSAAAWLDEQPAAGDESAAIVLPPAQSRARKAYEGEAGDDSPGRAERDGDPYLQRVYENFDALWSGGEFDGWARCLLQPLRACLRQAGSGDSDGAAGSEGGSQ